MIRIALLIAFVLYNANASADDRPNIVLLMGDDHGWDETGYNGHPHLKTPVLDQMAADGLKLDRFYSAHPTCSPTRGSVMTARHPNRYGTFTPGYSIRPEEITIAQLLHDAGYRCGHFGKWHLGPVKVDSPTSPGAMGFDEYVSHDNFFELDPWLSRNGEPPVKIEGESSQIVIDEAIKFMRRTREGDQPFFTVVWFGSPHEPYSGLPDDLALYNDLPSQYSGQETTLTSNETGSPTRRPLGEVLQERYAEITAMDRSIGTMRQWLAENDLREDTLLWYCGDNGTSRDGIVTSPLRGEKGDHYEGGVRVPGVIEWPNRIKSPRASDVNSVTTDIMPTLCDIVGLPLPDRPLDGISLKPLIEDRMDSRPKPICFWSFDTKSDKQNDPYLLPVLQRGTTPLVKKMNGSYTRDFKNFRHPEVRKSDYGGTRSILSDQYKLVVRGNDQSAKRELFDIRDDPEETTNLLKSKPEAAAKLQEELTQWQSSVLQSLTGADYPRRLLR